MTIKRNQKARQNKHYLRCPNLRPDSIAGSFSQFDESLPNEKLTLGLLEGRYKSFCSSIPEVKRNLYGRLAHGWGARNIAFNDYDPI